MESYADRSWCAGKKVWSGVRNGMCHSRPNIASFDPWQHVLPLFKLLDVKVGDWAAGMSRSGVVHFHSLRSASFRSWTLAYPLQGHWFFQVSMVVWFWHNLGLHHVVIWCPCARSPIPLLPVPRAGDPKVRCVWSLDRRRIGRIDENLWNLLPDPVWFTTATSRGQNHVEKLDLPHIPSKRVNKK